MKKYLLSLLVLIISVFCQASPIVGTWSGSIDVMGNKLPLVFHIDADGNGFKATLDSPKQNATGIPVTSVALTSDSIVDIKIEPLRASFHGIIKSDGMVIDGTFTQGMAFPLVLKKGTYTADVAKRRPQDPTEPYPYKSEDVTFSHDGITLAGTLTLPSSGKNFPAVVLVSGSGQQNRDEELMNHRPFLVLSDYLTRHGIAVLRYDDRGVGGSNGLSDDNTSADFAKDTECAMKYLKGRNEINSKKIGIIGHSEGGLIATMIGAKGAEKPAFIVSMAGPTIKGADLMIRQNEMLFEAQGKKITPAEKDNIVRTFNAIYTISDIDSLRNELRSLIKETIPADQNNERNIEQAIKQLSHPWFRYFVAYDPSTDIRALRCPMLAIGGDMDTQVDAKINLAKVEGMKNNTTKLYPNRNHLFQTVNKPSLPWEYSSIDETISEEVMSDITNWIIAVSK